MSEQAREDVAQFAPAAWPLPAISAFAGAQCSSSGSSSSSLDSEADGGGAYYGGPVPSFACGATPRASPRGSNSPPNSSE